MGQVVRKKVWFYGYDPVEQVVCRLPRSGENKMTRGEERDPNLERRFLEFTWRGRGIISVRLRKTLI